MTPKARQEAARGLMTAFVARTGIAGREAQRRYLWTDALAVCTLLELARGDADGPQLALARQLVDRVHHVLGRHRPDDPRRGWLSGLSDADGEQRPTAGGLRIGKPLPERRADEPLEEHLEWQRDGQYFHYLTRWAHALDQVRRATGVARFGVWATELMQRAHRAFVWQPRPDAPKRLYWKCSIDLSRPLVATMGQHDPLDGFVTCLQLGAAAPESPLRAAAADFGGMLDLHALATSDPLGIGGLLSDAYRVHQLSAAGSRDGGATVVVALLDAAAAGLREYVPQPDLLKPAAERLAFRELGLAIGLAAVQRLHGEAPRLDPAVRACLERVEPYAVLRDTIATFWLEAARRDDPAWRAHADINDVTLATSLVPDGYLVLRA
jgi:hypothetical protein